MLGIDPPRHRTSSRLERLVSANKNSGPAGGVGLCSHKPVAVGLPQRIVSAIEDVKEDRPGREGALRVVDILDKTLSVTSILPLLESVSTTPDRHTSDEQHNPSESGTSRALQHRQIEKNANDKAADHLREPVQGSVQRPRPNIERHTVHIVLLIRVEHIGAEEQRQHAQHPPITQRRDGHLQHALQALLLRLGGSMQLRQADSLRRADEEAEDPADEHDGHQRNVRGVVDGAGCGVEVEAEGGEGADAAAEVEDDPEDGDGAALLGLVDVGGHDCALNDPDEGGADAEDCAGGDDEGAVCVVWDGQPVMGGSGSSWLTVEAEETSAVQSVGPATHQKADLGTDEGEDGADDEEGGYCGG